jgi:hypothetical protein
MAETHARITVVNNEAALKVCQFGDELLQVSPEVKLAMWSHYLWTAETSTKCQVYVA